MTNELVQLSVSAQIVLAGIFPAIIIGLGIAYWLHQRRARRRDGSDDDANKQ